MYNSKYCILKNQQVEIGNYPNFKSIDVPLKIEIVNNKSSNQGYDNNQILHIIQQNQNLLNDNLQRQFVVQDDRIKRLEQLVDTLTLK